MAARRQLKGRGVSGPEKPKKEASYEPVPEPRMGGRANQAELDRALFHAVWFHDIEKAVDALRKGANPNAQDEMGNTPIIYAVMPYLGYKAGKNKYWRIRINDPFFDLTYSCSQISGALQGAGADAHLKNHDGHNALSIAESWCPRLAEALKFEPNPRKMESGDESG